MMLDDLSSWTVQLGFATFVVLLGIGVQHQIGRHRNRAFLQSLPIADVIDNDWKEAITRASVKWPDEPWILPSEPPRVILPNRVMDEIRLLPETEVSLRKEVYSKMHGRYTDMGTDHPVGIAAIKAELTNNINVMLPALQEETQYALTREFQPIAKDQWTRIPLYGKLLQLSALVNGRMFVGLPLCRDQHWIDLSISYTLDVIDTIKALHMILPVLQRFQAPFLTQIRNLKSYKRRALQMLRPYIDEVVKVKRTKTSGGQYNLIAWMLEHMERPDYELLASEQLFAGFGSIHATCITLTNAIYDLAAHPQYIPELRAEINDVISKEPDQIIRKASLPKLVKLDSFLRESHRMTPVSLTSIHRTVVKKSGISLSTGHHMPCGTSLGFLNPLAPFVEAPPNLTLPTSRIPSQPPLSTFYPFRSSEVRALPGQINYHQFAMTAPDNINFGHGPMSCPGRFFAAAEVKVILCEILRRYDMALGPNGERQGQNGYFRPANIVQAGSLQYLPDFTASVYFRLLEITECAS